MIEPWLTERASSAKLPELADYLRLVRFYSLAVLASWVLVMMALSIDRTLGLIALIAALTLLIGLSAFRARQVFRRTKASGSALPYVGAYQAAVLESLENSIGAPTQTGLSPGSAQFLRIWHELLMEHELRIEGMKRPLRPSQELPGLSTGFPG